MSGSVTPARPEPPARVLFFGSGRFAVPILEALAARPATLTIVGVVTAPDRPSGRGGRTMPTPVASVAMSLGLPILRPTRVRAPEVVAVLADRRADLGVLADYGQLIPAALLALPPHGILNVHPSLLPRHRGATPVAGTILAGDAEGGVTVMAMDEGLDTGPILAQSRWPLAPDVRAPDLEARAAEAGAALVLDVLPEWLAGRIVPRPQDPAAATMTRPFRREDGRLDPGRPAVELERAVRALDPWPGTWLETERGRLAVVGAEVAPSPTDDVPGVLVADGRGLALATVDGRLRLHTVRPAGGTAMSAEAFRRGAGRALAGTRVTGPVSGGAGGSAAAGAPAPGASVPGADA